MSEAEYERFVAACEDGTLCDTRYCPYMKGERPGLELARVTSARMHGRVIVS